MVAAGSAGSAALCHVWVRSQVVQLGYEIATEKRAADELAQANQRLRLEVDSLKNPARVELIARRDLKMEPPDPAHIRATSRRLTAANAAGGAGAEPFRLSSVAALRSSRTLR